MELAKSLKKYFFFLWRAKNRAAKIDHSWVKSRRCTVPLFWSGSQEQSLIEIFCKSEPQSNTSKTLFDLCGIITEPLHEWKASEEAIHIYPGCEICNEPESASRGRRPAPWHALQEKVGTEGEFPEAILAICYGRKCSSWNKR